MQHSPDYTVRVQRFVRQLTIAFPGVLASTNPGPKEWAKKPIRRLVRWHLGRKYSSPPPDPGAVNNRSASPGAGTAHFVLPTTKQRP